MTKEIPPVVHKAFSTNCKISPDETRTVVACISSSAVDRAGDVLIPQGLNSKDFELNPLVMLNHEYDPSCAVGKVTAIKRTDDQVVAKIQFAARPDTYPDDEEWYPDTLFDLYRQGIMSAFSVGFIPTDSRAANSADVRKYGDECRQVINRWKLLELSCVAIPCQQEAVAQAVSKSLANKLFKAADEPVKSDEDNMQTCSVCGKRYPADDMTMEDDEYTCSACATDEKGEQPTEAVPADEAKEIIREIAQTKRIVTAVELMPDVPMAVKCVTRFIPPPEVQIAAKVHKVVIRTISKLRGNIYSN